MSLLHLHLILNHVPVVGAAFLVVLLAVAVARRDTKLVKMGLMFSVLLAVVTAVVYFTGEPAEELAENISGVSELSISLHEEAAKFSTIAFTVMGLLALGTLIFSRGKPVSRALSVTALSVALIVSGMMAWTANLGGNIRHTELQTASAAVSGEHDD